MFNQDRPATVWTEEALASRQRVIEGTVDVITATGFGGSGGPRPVEREHMQRMEGAQRATERHCWKFYTKTSYGRKFLPFYFIAEIVQSNFGLNLLSFPHDTPIDVSKLFKPSVEERVKFSVLAPLKVRISHPIASDLFSWTKKG